MDASATLSVSETHAPEAAREAGLRYVNDDMPGIRRRRAGKGFAYYGPKGQPIRDPGEIKRIKSLAIPPAYTDVWICPDPNGHIQATGRDDRGRKQYRYHPKWREIRDEAKYERMLVFGQKLPGMRERLNQDLARHGMPREKVLAAVTKLLETTLIRVGNDEYAKGNDSYGLTTMQHRHVEVEGSQVRFKFRGKHGKSHEIQLRDRRLARVVKRCDELPGQELFSYVDEGGVVRDVTSSDINAYLKEISGEPFTAKDFRTFFGTVLAAMALQEFEEVDSQAKAKRNVTKAIEKVASKLGNTPAICRKCYVHPRVVESYLEGSLIQQIKTRIEETLAESLSGLSAEESAVLAFLHERLEREEAAPPADLATALRASAAAAG